MCKMKFKGLKFEFPESPEFSKETIGSHRTLMTNNSVNMQRRQKLNISLERMIHSA
jgi:hypothetical protein